MAKATQTFHAFDPETGKYVVFKIDDEVPDHIAAKVGAHVVDEKPDLPADAGDEGGESPFDGEAFDQAVAAKVEEVVEQRVSDAVDQAVDELRDRERAAHEAITGREAPFDPAADGVTAAAVKEYLTGLDQDTVAGAAEYSRVVEAEKAGQNRSSAIPS